MMHSNFLIDEWQGDVSVFTGQFRTVPMHIKQKVTAKDLVDIVCPIRPFITTEKANAPYALPCSLRNAPLIGKTLERAKEQGLSLNGLMRSAAHVTEGGWIKLDLDSSGREETRDLLDKLNREGIGYLVYSTHSHGFKPRNRLRLILFLDRALAPGEYKRASLGAALWLLGQSLDSSEGNLHQLAGVYMCHPDRQNKTFRLVDIGGDRCCVNADALLALIPEKPKSTAYSQANLLAITETRMSIALAWIDANEFATWVKVGMALKALEVSLGIEAMALWHNFSERANDSSKAHNDDDQYNPITMWGSFTPTMPEDAATGMILGLAKKAAGAVLRDELAYGSLRDPGHHAVAYLEQYHPRFLNALLADAKVEGDL